MVTELLSSYAFWENASHQQKVLDSHLHYLSCGEKGKPILFLHGMPGSSFLWRNIMPELSDKRRCIAPDLIGMGHSGHPGIGYTLDDHIRYVQSFIDARNLQDIVLVVHGWGSVIGLDIASRDPDRFAGIVMCESHIRPIDSWNDLSLPVQEFFNELGEPDAARRLIVDENFLLDQWLPRSVMRKLNDEEVLAYQTPFLEKKKRDVLLQYVQDLPRGDGNDAVTQLIAHYSTWLANSPIPKLLMYAMPGFITPIETVAWAKRTLSNLSCVELPESLHFVQETSPERFVFTLREWLATHFS